MTDTPILRVDSARKEYDRAGAPGRFRRGERERFVAVDDVSITLARGETLSVVGESGSGKSTLGRMILGLTEPTSGSIEFEGVDVTRRSSRQRRELTREMQVVFQDPYSSIDPRSGSKTSSANRSTSIASELLPSDANGYSKSCTRSPCPSG